MQPDQETARAISASLLRIHRRSAFFTALAMHAHFEISERVPTAATDGMSVFVNPGFWAKLTRDEQDALLMHEVLHAALLHVPRRGGRDPQLWNVAADVVINGMLDREGFKLPEGGLRDRNLERFSVEEAYDLLARKQQNQKPTPQQADLLDGPPDDATGKAAGDTSDDAQASDAAAIERHWREAQEQARVTAAASMHGTLPSHLEREFGALKAEKLDWRAYLWRYLTKTPTDFQHFDRRFVGRGMYLEALEGETVNVLVAVDTSGSINNDAVQSFVNEVRGILRSYPHLRCELYYADTELYGPHTLTPRSELPPPKGGGGTDFRPFFARANARRSNWTPSVAVYLTDGYGSFPDHAPIIPTLWVVTPGGLDLDRFPFGQTVRLIGSA